MNRLSDSLNKINYYSVLLFAFFVSFTEKIHILTCFLWILTWTLSKIVDYKNIKINKLRDFKPVYLLFFFFICMSISFLYSKNSSSFFDILQRRITFLIFPFMALIGFNKYYKKNMILVFFILGCLISLVFVWSLPVFKYFFGEDDFFLRCNPISGFIKLVILFRHRTYFCLFQILSILSIFYLKKIFINKIGANIYYLFLSIYVVSSFLLALILGARIILLLYLLLFIIISYKSISFNKRRSRNIFFVGISLFVVLSTYYLLNYNRRFKKIDISNIFSPLNMNEKEPRIGIWYSAVEILNKDHKWVTGVGSGDFKDILAEQYKKNGLTNSFENRYHAHNEILNDILEFGILGLLIIVFLFYYVIYYNRKNKDYTILVMLSFACVMMVEVVSFTANGVLAFSAFVLFFSFQSSENNIKIKKIKGLIKIYLPILLLSNFVTIPFLYMYKKDFNSDNPATYSSSNYTPVRVLPGKVPSVLDACIGYKLSAGAESIYWKKYNTAAFYSSIFPSSTDSIFSVWCYVSKDFDGSDVRIGAGCNNDDYYSYYNMKIREKWQLLSFKFLPSKNNTEIPFSMFFCKKGVKNFKSLKGYVIFAKPHFN